MGGGGITIGSIDIGVRTIGRVIVCEQKEGGGGRGLEVVYIFLGYYIMGGLAGFGGCSAGLSGFSLLWFAFTRL